MYFDVESGVSCTDYKTANSKTGYNGLINKDNEGNQTERLSTQTSCLKFYAFNDDGGNKLNLLLDHNTTKTVAWTNSTITTNKEGPIDLKFQLYNDTKDWNGTITPLNYTIDQRDQGSETYYTIEYNKIPLYEGATTAYKARLLTAQEIAIITGNVNWDEKTSVNGFYFDSNSFNSSSTCYNGNTTGCKYGWIYTRTNQYCRNYGCSNGSESDDFIGYWLASSVSKYDIYAWYVYFKGTTHKESVTTANYIGVRPVIEVLKSNLK